MLFIARPASARPLETTSLRLRLVLATNRLALATQLPQPSAACLPTSRPSTLASRPLNTVMHRRCLLSREIPQKRTLSGKRRRMVMKTSS